MEGSSLVGFDTGASYPESGFGRMAPESGGGYQPIIPVKKVGLVITRRRGESFVVDGPCEVTVFQISQNQVKLAIRAGDDVRILRSELLK